MRTRHFLPTLALTIALATSAACSSSGSSDGVASLGGASGGDNGEAAAGSDEEQLLDYVECLRDQGLDVPDPQVDAEGNLRLGMRVTPDESDGGQRVAPDDFRAAQEVCGGPPEGVVGGPGGGDQSEMQDAALAFAQCLRDRGFDVPDPDFSGGGVRFGGSGAGEMGEIFDSTDPEVQAAVESCRQETGAGLGGGGRATRGGGQ